MSPIEEVVVARISSLPKEIFLVAFLSKTGLSQVGQIILFNCRFQSEIGKEC